MLVGMVANSNLKCLKLEKRCQVKHLGRNPGPIEGNRGVAINVNQTRISATERESGLVLVF